MSDEDGEPASEKEDEDEPGANEEGKLLADYRHKLESDLRQPSRNLLVRDFMVTFNPETTYGQRAGFLKGLLITAAGLIQNHTLEFKSRT